MLELYLVLSRVLIVASLIGASSALIFGNDSVPAGIAQDDEDEPITLLIIQEGDVSKSPGEDQLEVIVQNGDGNVLMEDKKFDISEENVAVPVGADQSELYSSNLAARSSQHQSKGPGEKRETNKPSTGGPGGPPKPAEKSVTSEDPGPFVQSSDVAPRKPDSGAMPLYEIKKTAGTTQPSGENSKKGEFPFLARFVTLGRVTCGGSLLSRNWVITAAHCFMPPYQPSMFEVVFGDHDARLAEKEEQHFKVVKAVTHEHYNRTGVEENDIALVLVQGVVEFNDFVGPINLPHPWDYEISGYAVIAGWGFTGFPDKQSGPRKATLPILPLDVCTEYFPFVSGRQLCVQEGPESIIGKNRGDPGGPILCTRSSGLNTPTSNSYSPDEAWRKHQIMWDKKRQYLCGVVSFGSGLRTLADTPCVGARVYQYMAWITRVIKSHTASKQIEVERFPGLNGWTDCMIAAYKPHLVGELVLISWPPRPWTILIQNLVAFHPVIQKYGQSFFFFAENSVNIHRAPPHIVHSRIVIDEGSLDVASSFGFLGVVTTVENKQRADMIRRESAEAAAAGTPGQMVKRNPQKRQSDEDVEYYCAGVLLKRNLALTSADCVPANGGFDLQFSIGIAEDGVTSPQTTPIRSVFLFHPNTFRQITSPGHVAAAEKPFLKLPDSRVNKAAVLRLKNNITFSSHIYPAWLPTTYRFEGLKAVLVSPAVPKGLVSVAQAGGDSNNRPRNRLLGSFEIMPLEHCPRDLLNEYRLHRYNGMCAKKLQNFNCEDFLPGSPLLCEPGRSPLGGEDPAGGPGTGRKERRAARQQMFMCGLLARIPVPKDKRRVKMNLSWNNQHSGMEYKPAGSQDLCVFRRIFLTDRS